MTLGRLFGARIVVHPFFLVLVVLLAAADLLAETLVVFSVVFLHEMGHAVVARSKGLNVREVELLPIGGVARIDDLVEIDPAVEMAVAVAGPLTNLLLIGLASVEAGIGLVPPEWRSLFVQANALIGGFNLLPALPLDGGRVLRASMSRRIGFRRATDRAARVGKAVAVCLGAAWAAGLLLGYANPSPLAVAVFLYFAAGKEQELSAYVFMRYLARKQSDLQRSRCLASHHLVALVEAPIKDVLPHFVPRRYHIVWAIDGEGKVVGFATERDLIEAMFTRGVDSTVGDVLRRVH